ncbi:hypothetical protein PCL1606_05740 [Pseudomonas chlororaphis]|uniref:Uncharacterized protein n=1 Tax=Pseudomonas chlororaphis TaxID=587753 RepID=A0A0D5XSG5_9PSED|nr:hypothetical protein PCL1606_05740 [Pseudomonas chlororaphis]
MVDQKAHVTQGSFVLGHGRFSGGRSIQPTAAPITCQSQSRR